VPGREAGGYMQWLCQPAYLQLGRYGLRVLRGKAKRRAKGNGPHGAESRRRGGARG